MSLDLHFEKFFGFFLIFLVYGSISCIYAAEKSGGRFLNGPFMLFMASRVKGGRGISHTSPLSTRVRVTTAGGFASKASIGISSVCLGLRLQTCNTHWLGWAPPVNPLSGPSRCDRPKHPNGPPGSLRAGLLLDRAVSGNRQIA